jgi:uncharacterized protein
MDRTVLVDTSRSPHARLRPVPIGGVRLNDTFWHPRQLRNGTNTLPTQYQQCESTGRIDNFRRASGRKNGVPFHGIYYNDSDVYKWIEACAWQLAIGRDAAIEEMVESVIEEIAAAQQPDGYLNTYFMFELAKDRWSNLKDKHELYCAGHLMQAAVAHHRVTGRDGLLRVAMRFADHICSRFGPAAEGKVEGTCGHQEIEMALVELARETGEQRYLKQAQYFIDARGRGLIGGSPYHQDHKPLREMEAVTGHAVRMLYYASGATDFYAERGDRPLLDGLQRLWTRMAQRVTYVTGGQGARWEGEAFGSDYELPNARAYTETCAAIANVMWCWRMLQLDGDARYADMMELALYNGVLSGISLDGEHYFYQNPLENDGTHRRQPWFDCACCPSNITRLLPQLNGYFYSTGDDSLWVHLYASGSAEIVMPSGNPVRLEQATDYPWNGEVQLKIDADSEFELRLRVPAWCSGAAVSVNGEEVGTARAGTYASIRRRWRAGDVVKLTLPMPPRQIEAHPFATDNAGKVALARGPLIYCLEQIDQPVDPRSMLLPADAKLSSQPRPDLLGGVVVIEGQLLASDDQADLQLYRTAGSATRSTSAVRVVAIPYYAWANRKPSRMAVWIRRA